jgi:DNA-directed RNA polymerase subunit RPC12/RpoP
MDIVFNCPKCEQELEVDSTGAGSQIECPNCQETIVIPHAGTDGARTAGAPASGSIPTGGIPTLPPAQASSIATSAAAKVEMHLKVPVHNKPVTTLIARTLKPLEVTARESDKKIRVKTIRHTDCIEVGHDTFDEVVSNFLQMTGEPNIISITPMSYTHADIGSQKLLTEYAVMIVYRG